ncbi:hypothetical protein JWG45_17930 [Leptospira sp. 201903070]|uniref:Uncharacterized protein n=1 Tax=Leptospira ainlahdjerensis TaxID=2810033 RepID=A0ABS2UF87_9LEPT|nr:hypothetical protein [Leptospira ainlahdjerensis]MBM9579030.1 hypothetical protein [Leptospira ainlahdjerensis]
MSKHRLKIGILLLLLLGWAGREIHTHSEKEFRLPVLHSEYTSQVEVKHSPSCPVCQFQRNLSSLWNPNFLIPQSSLILTKENSYFSNTRIPSLTIIQIQRGRAPPFSI